MPFKHPHSQKHSGLTDAATQAELQRGHSLHWMGATSSPTPGQHGGGSPAPGIISPCPPTSIHVGSPCRSPLPSSPSPHQPTLQLISPTPSPPVPPTTPPSIPSELQCLSPLSDSVFVFCLPIRFSFFQMFGFL